MQNVGDELIDSTFGLSLWQQGQTDGWETSNPKY
jgi:hypothetical protein